MGQCGAKLRTTSTEGTVTITSALLCMMVVSTTGLPCHLHPSLVMHYFCHVTTLCNRLYFLPPVVYFFWKWRSETVSGGASGLLLSDAFLFAGFTTPPPSPL